MARQVGRNSEKKESLTHGDRSTRFFHSRSKHLNARNTIFRLKTNDQPTIADTLIQAFKQRFSSSVQPNRNIDLSSLPQLFTTQEKEDLIKPFSDEEIKNGFFDMNPLKSLGSDRFGHKLFQAYWPIVGTEITTTIKDFFYHGKISKALNHTIIALIPKPNNLENSNNFRPISLCNIIYKAISKLLVLRLRHVLQIHIILFQNTYIPERSIHDNLLIVQEILNTFQI